MWTALNPPAAFVQKPQTPSPKKQSPVRAWFLPEVSKNSAKHSRADHELL